MISPVSWADGAPRVVDDPQLSIQQVSTILNLPAPTIRSWERRYGVPAADRSSGGHRRYTSTQLDSLRRLRDLIALGRRPGQAAALVKDGQPTPPGPLIDAFLRGAHALAPDSIIRTLDVGRQTLGLDRTVDEVLVPALRQIGDGWHADRIDIAHEHLATNATRAWLSNLAATGPLRSEPPIILCCGPRDHHTLGLEAFGALLRQRRFDCRLLGARTPVDSLARAVEETNAVAVVIVCHVTTGRPAAIEALRSNRLRRLNLFYAGGGFTSRRARNEVPGRYLGTHFAQAADLVAHVVTGATVAGLT